MSVSNLMDWTPARLKDWFHSFDAVLADCDGVLWHEDVAIEGSPEVLNAWQASGKRVFLVTNNSVKTRRNVWERAVRLGYHVKETQIIAPSYNISRYLKDCNIQQHVYVIGSSAIASELDSLGIKHIGVGADILAAGTKLTDYIQQELTSTAVDVGAVIVGFDEHFNFCKMLKASQYLMRDPACHFLCTNADVVFKCPTVHIPDTGAFLKSIEAVVGREAKLFGKPSRAVCAGLIEQGVLVPERTLMIGDSATIDVQFGKNCGFHTLLVGSGQAKWAEVEVMLQQPKKHERYIPEYYLPKLGDLAPFL